MLFLVDFDVLENVNLQFFVKGHTKKTRVIVHEA